MSQFLMGWNPLWAWVYAVLDPQDAIKELMNCVLRRFSEDYALNHPVAEENGESAGKGEEAPEDCLLPPLVIGCLGLKQK